jgi:hypothetical protein
MFVSTFFHSEIGRQLRFAAIAGGLMVAGIWLCLQLGCPSAQAAVRTPPATTKPVAAPAVVKPAPPAPRGISSSQPAAVTAPVASKFPKTAFHQAFCAAMRQRGMDPESVCNPADPAELRILAEYGAIFVADAAIRLPPGCIFGSEAAVTQFQTTAPAKSIVVNRTTVTLQPAALAAFQAACAEAKQARLSISLHGGAKASRRSLADTEEVWNRYVEEALRNWQKKGRISREEVIRLRELPPIQQADEILKLESKGLYFGLAQHKTILSSAAVPGASQHLSLLALDIAEYANPDVRRILARHGWYQTVLDDFPHFTWLGVAEEKLPGLGLHPVTSSHQVFWLPEVKE